MPRGFPPTSQVTQGTICHVVPHDLQQGAACLGNWGPCSPNRVQASSGQLPGVQKSRRQRSVSSRKTACLALYLPGLQMRKH